MARNSNVRILVAVAMAVIGLIAALSARFKGVSQQHGSLIDARLGFHSHLTPSARDRQPPDQPPPGTFNLVRYRAAVGELPAYLTPDPGDGKMHPAIVWITGGDCNSIGDVWSPSPRNNDQSAAAYRQAGIVMMFPSLRGGNQNPGEKEGFFGETDDVAAAADYLKNIKYVDPARIYLGGHSTGGTLAMLAAECSNRYRAVFAYGPVGDVSGYGAETGFVPADLSDRKEVLLRSPGYWLGSIKDPTWVLEGASQGNIRALRSMANSCTNPQIHFIEISNATHFTSLAPTNELIAQKIVADSGPTCTISLTTDEVNANFDKSGS